MYRYPPTGPNKYKVLKTLKSMRDMCFSSKQTSTAFYWWKRTYPNIPRQTLLVTLNVTWMFLFPSQLLATTVSTHFTYLSWAIKTKINTCKFTQTFSMYGHNLHITSGRSHLCRIAEWNLKGVQTVDNRISQIARFDTSWLFTFCFKR